MESTPEQAAEGMAVVRVLAAVLDRLVNANTPLARADPGQLTKFHALKAPGIGILQYLERIHKYASCSTECFILALIYIDRLIQRNNFLLTELNVHRVVITAVLLAAKFFDDAYYNNAYYAKVGGVLVSEMNGLEVEFLFRINFSLHVGPDIFQKYHAELVAHAVGAGLEQPKVTMANISSQNALSFGVAGTMAAEGLLQEQAPHCGQVLPHASACNSRVTCNDQIKEQPLTMHYAHHQQKAPQITPSPPPVAHPTGLPPHVAPSVTSASVGTAVSLQVVAPVAPITGTAGASQLTSSGSVITHHNHQYPPIELNESLSALKKGPLQLVGLDTTSATTFSSAQTDCGHYATQQPNGAVTNLPERLHSDVYSLGLSSTSQPTSCDQLLMVENNITYQPSQTYIAHYQHQQHQKQQQQEQQEQQQQQHQQQLCTSSHAAGPLVCIEPQVHPNDMLTTSAIPNCRDYGHRQSSVNGYIHDATAPLTDTNDPVLTRHFADVTAAVGTEVAARLLAGGWRQ